MAVVQKAGEVGCKGRCGVLATAVWLAALGMVAAGSVESAEAQVRYASGKRSNAAIAHYARARAMCVETLEEFEVGRKHARPDLLLDAEEWRLTMISLCEKLNRLVDPKIRVSNSGIQVNANPRLIHRADDRLPEVADGPKSRNDAGEAARLKEKQEARARMYAPEETEAPEPADAQAEAPQAAVPAVQPTEELSEEALIEQAIQEAINQEAAGLNQAEAEGQADFAGQDPQQPTDADLYDPALETPGRTAAEATSARPDLERQGEEVEREVERRIEAQADGQVVAPNEAAPQDEDVAEIPAAREALNAGEKDPVNGEDAKIASAIEQAIQDKLREIEDAGTRSEDTPPADPENYDEE